MLLAPIPGRIWGLPFLTALAQSERYARQAGRRHKPLADCQLLLLASRWLPGRRVIAVADTTYAVIDLLAALRHRLTMITRLRLDARLFDPPPAPEAAAGSPASASPCSVSPTQPTAGAASRSASGMARASGSWISGPALRCIPAGACRSAGCWCATSWATMIRKPSCAPTWRLTRWTSCAGSSGAGRSRSRSKRSAATLASSASEGHRPHHAGLAGAVLPRAHDLAERGRLNPRGAAWYPKRRLTFSDALGAVRRKLWEDGLFQTSGQSRDMVKIPAPLAQRLLEAACFPA